MKVHFTVDVEVWCGWEDMERRFPDAFRRYVYGPTLRGNYGLPMTLALLRDRGLAGTFFVEALFAARFGVAPLAEIVGLVRDAGQAVELHVHPEWADEAREPFLARGPKRPYFCRFEVQEQAAMIEVARGLLQSAGASAPRAFRAGSFGADRRTLEAVKAAGVAIDASFNASMPANAGGRIDADTRGDVDTRGESDTRADALPLLPARIDGVLEYPMTVFRDALGRLRHLQLAAASSAEMEAVLWQGQREGWPAMVILSHNFELLNAAKTRPDDVVVQRFRRLCRFLERHRDVFETVTFDDVAQVPAAAATESRLPRAPIGATLRRYAEQALRSTYG